MSVMDELSPRHQQEVQFMTEYLAPLAGSKIVKIQLGVSDEYNYLEIWPELHIETADGQKLVVTVSADPEMNRPGHLAGLPL